MLTLHHMLFHFRIELKHLYFLLLLFKDEKRVIVSGPSYFVPVRGTFFRLTHLNFTFQKITCYENFAEENKFEILAVIDSFRKIYLF